VILQVVDAMRGLAVLLHGPQLIKLKSPPKGGGLPPHPRGETFKCVTDRRFPRSIFSVDNSERFIFLKR
jgi:hypothetical protein